MRLFALIDVQLIAHRPAH